MEEYEMEKNMVIFGWFFWWFNGHVYGYGGFMVIFFRDFMVIEFYFLMENMLW